MKYELWYSVVVRDRQGKVVSRERRRSRSFLKQWNQLIYVHFQGIAGLDIKDTDGVDQTVSPVYDDAFNMTSAAGITGGGIRVGTGNTPVAIDDYALETLIEEGAGAGEMNYLICTVATSVVAAPSCSFVVSRSIVNNSPAEITVREAAIYMEWRGSRWICGTRDVFVTPQAVPIGGTITVNWTIQVTV